MRAYSQDIRLRIVRAYESGEGSQRELAARFKVSLSFVRDLLRRLRETGSIEPQPVRGGYAPKVDADAMRVIRRLLQERPEATLGELCARYNEQSEKKVSRATMCRARRKIYENTRIRPRITRHSRHAA